MAQFRSLRSTVVDCLILTSAITISTLIKIKIVSSQKNCHFVTYLETLQSRYCLSYEGFNRLFRSITEWHGNRDYCYRYIDSKKHNANGFMRFQTPQRRCNCEHVRFSDGLHLNHCMGVRTLASSLVPLERTNVGQPVSQKRVPKIDYILQVNRRKNIVYISFIEITVYSYLNGCVNSDRYVSLQIDTNEKTITIYRANTDVGFVLRSLVSLGAWLYNLVVLLD